MAAELDLKSGILKVKRLDRPTVVNLECLKAELMVVETVLILVVDLDRIKVEWMVVTTVEKKDHY